MKPFLIFLAVFLIFFASRSANLDDSLVGRMGFTADYLSVSILSLACAALVIRRHKVIVTTAALLMILAGLPPSMTGNILNRDLLYALFIAVLVAPYVADRFE